MPHHPTPPVPVVSVVIPCRNEVEHISNVLQSILSHANSLGGIEIIVADGNSSDGTRELLANIAANTPLLRVVDNPERIASAGLNRAIRAARGQIIVRMDAHTTYAEDYVQQCVAVLRETGADNVGGAARTQASGYLQRAIAAAYHSPFSVGGARFHDDNYEGFLDTVTYGCWPRKTFETYGYFDEELVRNQDDEHNLRIIRGGGRVWQSPRIRSWYTPRNSITDLFRQYRQYGYWKVRVIQKHRIPASFRHLVPGAFVGSILLCLLASPLSLWARLLGLATFLPYIVTLIAASLYTASRTDWRLAPVLPLVFSAYHFGYGTGFLMGLLDFCVLKRRSGRASEVNLTRSEAP